MKADYNHQGNSDFPRVLKWKKRHSSQHLTILFTEQKEPFPPPMTYRLEQIALLNFKNSCFPHELWAEAFRTVVVAADNYRTTDSQAVSSFQP